LIEEGSAVLILKALFFLPLLLLFSRRSLRRCLLRRLPHSEALLANAETLNQFYPPRTNVSAASAFYAVQ
jgi:hypothetical protein